MMTNLDLTTKIAELQLLLHHLQRAKSFADKLDILNELDVVKNFLHSNEKIYTFATSANLRSNYVVKSIIAIGQGPIIFNMINCEENFKDRFEQLLRQLFNIEEVYKHMGGIIGYHLAILQHIVNQNSFSNIEIKNTRYIHPEGLHLEENDFELMKIIHSGISNLKNIALFCPVGGAGDRLDLREIQSDVQLPAALLSFLGRSLLEGIIRDLEGLEYIYFKIFNERLIIPIAIMTSSEKDNHLQILNLFKTNQWFGRDPDSFRFFIQPSVPVLTIEGNWSLCEPLKLNLKPCGHGVIWKLAEEQGIFDWLESQDKHHLLVRQINNPLAGIDNLILAFLGLGFRRKHAFGFVSCERLLNSEEGINILIEKQNNGFFDYSLTNIEYTDFQKHGVNERPVEAGGPYSIYPSNTNILFASITTVRQVIKDQPIPGQLINMKSKVAYIDSEGRHSFIQGGRLESTMQNIADYIVDRFSYQLDKNEYQSRLRTFILYNQRLKTISTTKKSYSKGSSLISTPEQAFYDHQLNQYELLKKCHFDLPKWTSIQDYLNEGPSVIFLFHPALGPLHAIIAQKVRGGKFAFQSEFQLEIAEVDIENLSLDGSLLIESKNRMQLKNQESRCTMRNVSISNRGIDRMKTENYWKNQFIRHESFTIILNEGSEFHAENIEVKGSHHFEVPAYHRLILKTLSDGSLKEDLMAIKKPSWEWHYSLVNDDRLVLLYRSTNGHP